MDAQLECVGCAYVASSWPVGTVMQMKGTYDVQFPVHWLNHYRKLQQQVLTLSIQQLPSHNGYMVHTLHGQWFPPWVMWQHKVIACMECLRARTIDQHSPLCFRTLASMECISTCAERVLCACWIWIHSWQQQHTPLLLKTQRMHMSITRHCLHAWDSLKMMQETYHAIGNGFEAAETTCSTKYILMQSLSTPFPWQLPANASNSGVLPW